LRSSPGDDGNTAENQDRFVEPTSAGTPFLRDDKAGERAGHPQPDSPGERLGDIGIGFDINRNGTKIDNN
jgi:hypothetical protein